MSTNAAISLDGLLATLDSIDVLLTKHSERRSSNSCRNGEVDENAEQGDEEGTTERRETNRKLLDAKWRTEQLLEKLKGMVVVADSEVEGVVAPPAPSTGSTLLLPPPPSLVEKESVPEREVHLTLLFSSPLLVNDGSEKRPLDPIKHGEEKELILRAIESSGRCIKFREECATVGNFRSVLDRGCKAIHFSGHGVLGSPGDDSSEDALVFETPQGAAHLLDASTIGALLSTSGGGLRFVFTNCCHSQKVGAVFAAAGVEYCICVERNERVLDEAARSFAEAFYKAVCIGNKTVPAAFEAAKIQVTAAATADSSQFVLLSSRNAGTSSSPPLFKGIVAGEFTDMTERAVHNRIPAPPALCLGRARDIYEIVNLLKTSRLVTVTGAPGIGKTCLSRRLLHFLSPRKSVYGFRDGHLFVGLRGVHTPESTLASLSSALGIASSKSLASIDSIAKVPGGSAVSSIRRVSSTAVSVSFSAASSSRASIATDGSCGSSFVTKDENSRVPVDADVNGEGVVVSRMQKQQTQKWITSTTGEIVRYLSGSDVLIVLDNAEDPLNACPLEFRKLLVRILDASPKVRILVTSRQSIGGGLGEPERVYALSSLSPVKAAELLCRCAPRRLTCAEFSDPKKQKSPLDFLASHELVLKMLECHPQAITLAAPLLQDRSLEEVHTLLKKHGCRALEVVDIVDHSRTSNDTLRASLSVSLRHLRKRSSNNDDDSAVQFFLIFGLLSGGLFDFDLESIWAYYKRYVRFSRDELVSSPPRRQRAAWSKRSLSRAAATGTRAVTRKIAISRLAFLWSTSDVVMKRRPNDDDDDDDDDSNFRKRSLVENDGCGGTMKKVKGEEAKYENGAQTTSRGVASTDSNSWHTHAMRLMRASLIERSAVAMTRRRSKGAAPFAKCLNHYSTFSFFADYALRELEENFPPRVRRCLERSCFRRIVEVVEAVVGVFGRTSIEESDQLHKIWGKGHYEMNVWSLLKRATVMESESRGLRRRGDSTNNDGEDACTAAITVGDDTPSDEQACLASSPSPGFTNTKQNTSRKELLRARNFLKSLSKPPESVIGIVNVLKMLLTGKKISNWDEARHFLGHGGVLNLMQTFNVSMLSERTLQEATRLLENCEQSSVVDADAIFRWCSTVLKKKEKETNSDDTKETPTDEGAHLLKTTTRSATAVLASPLSPRLAASAKRSSPPRRMSRVHHWWRRPATKLALDFSAFLLLNDRRREALKAARCGIKLVANDVRAEAHLRKSLGVILLKLRSYQEARVELGKALILYGQLGSSHGRASSYLMIGFAHVRSSRYAGAESAFEKAYASYVDCAHLKGQIVAIRWQSTMALKQRGGKERRKRLLVLAKRLQGNLTKKKGRCGAYGKSFVGRWQGDSLTLGLEVPSESDRSRGL